MRISQIMVVSHHVAMS